MSQGDAQFGNLDLITPLEGELMAAVKLSYHSDTVWVLSLQLMFEGQPAGIKTFDLVGYTQEEAQQVARDVRNNAFIMREIDEYLWGESD